MRPIALIQARMGSFRLPGKVLLPLCGRPMLAHIVDRVRSVAELADVAVATSRNVKDDPIADWCAMQHVPCVRGSEEDVVERLYSAALSLHADPLLRILADCPLVDPLLIRQVLALWRDSWHDLVGVATGAGALYETKPRWPDGLDVECMSFAALAVAHREATTPADREHATMYLVRQPERFSIGRVYADVDLSGHRWTVDHPQDYALVQAVYEALWTPDRHFTTEDVQTFLEAHPAGQHAYFHNRRHVGQEGYEGLWSNAQC